MHLAVLDGQQISLQTCLFGPLVGAYILCEPNLHPHNSMMSMLELPHTYSQATVSTLHLLVNCWCNPLVLMPPKMRSFILCPLGILPMPIHIETTAMTMLADPKQPICTVFILNTHGTVQASRSGRRSIFCDSKTMSLLAGCRAEGTDLQWGS